MPRGKYKRRLPPSIAARETYDIDKGGYIDLDAANKAITEMKDRIAMLNQELDVKNMEALEAKAQAERYEWILDKMKEA